MSWSSLPTELQSQIIHSFISTTLTSILTSLPPRPSSQEVASRETAKPDGDFSSDDSATLERANHLIDAEIKSKTHYYPNTQARVPVTAVRELTKLTVAFPRFSQEIRQRCLYEEKRREKEAWCRSFWYSLLMGRYSGVFADGQVIKSFDCLSDKVKEWYEYRRKHYWGCVNCPNCIRRQMEELRGVTEVWEGLRDARRWWCLGGKHEERGETREKEREVKMMEEGEDGFGHVLVSVVRN